MGQAQNNVTFLFGDVEERVKFSSAQVANISAAVRSIVTMHLTVNMRAMFSAMDTMLFDHHSIDEHGEISRPSHNELHLLRMKYKHVEMSFIRQFEAMFSQGLLKTGASMAPVSRLQSLHTFLVSGDDELEASILLTHFACKAQMQYGPKLDTIQTGFLTIMRDTLASRGMKDVRSLNPISPTIISQAFKASAGSMDDDVIQLSILFDYFDLHVMQKLGNMYDQIIDLFRKVDAIKN